MWNKLNWFVWLLTVVLATVQLSWWYPQLPEVVPSHFNAAGQVDGEMAKPAFCLLFGGLQALMLLGMPLLGCLLRRMPDSLINMPNKEYWLAPERRDASLAVSFYMLLAISSLTGLLFLVVFQLSTQVAMKQRVGINPEMWMATVAYLVVVFGICGWSCCRFRMPRAGERDSAL